MCVAAVRYSSFVGWRFPSFACTQDDPPDIPAPRYGCLRRQYEKRFEKDDREKDRRKAREAMSDKIRMKIEFRQQVVTVVTT